MNLRDTHTLIWFINGDEQLSVRSRKAIEHKKAVNFVSIVSLWEIAIKISLGKLALNTPFTAIEKQLELNSINYFLLRLAIPCNFPHFRFSVEIRLTEYKLPKVLQTTSRLFPKTSNLKHTELKHFDRLHAKILRFVFASLVLSFA